MAAIFCARMDRAGATAWAPRGSGALPGLPFFILSRTKTERTKTEQSALYGAEC